MTLQEIAQVAQIVATVAVIASACTAVGVLCYTRRANRRRATLDFVMKTFVDEAGRLMYDKFIALTRKADDPKDEFTFVSLKAHTTENENDRNVVIDQMNIYELVALGIRNGVFDDGFFKYWYHSQFMRDYKALEQLLIAIQKDRPSTFCEFKSLHDKWLKNQHPVNVPNKFTKMWWAFRGKDEKLRSVLRVK